jgi:hypothetical protein
MNRTNSLTIMKLVSYYLFPITIIEIIRSKANAIKNSYGRRMILFRFFFLGL